MRIGILGRTSSLINAAELLAGSGHEIVFVWTCKAEEYYACDEKEFEKLANKLKCKYLCTPDVLSNIDETKGLNAELVVSINFINLIPSQFRQLFKHGVLNAHAGDLPRFRGNACPNWAILNGEKRIGLCVHEMADELDAGPIYVKRHFDLDDQTYIGDVYNWLNDVIPQMFLESADMIAKGKRPKPQDEKQRPLRAYPRKPSDSAIDWSTPVEQVLRLIRASSRPFEGAFCYLNGDESKKVSIFRADAADVDFDFLAVDGQLCFFEGDELFVACGGEMIRLSDYSLNGMKMSDSFKIIAGSLRNRLC